MKDALEELIATLTKANVFVGYTPLKDEPDFEKFLKERNLSAPLYRTKPDPSESPDETLKRMLLLAPEDHVAVFVPGRAFDAAGTRHGRGGGWYDRFLSKTPSLWIRVGVAHEKNVSDEKLVRESWDEPVDFVLIESSGSWRALETRRFVN